MKKKLICLFLISLTFGLIGIANVSAASDTPGYCFRFKNGTIYNYKHNLFYRSNCPDYNIVIPSEINGETVTKIAPRAFMEKGLVSVTIPNTVTSIGSLAFYGNDIDDITIPISVNYIGYGAFNCNSAGKYIFDPQDPTRLVSAAMYSRYDNIYYYYKIPNNTKIIGSKAFYGLEIEELIIPEGVTTLESDAFTGADIYYMELPASIDTGNINVDTQQIPYTGKIVYYGWHIVSDDGDYIGPLETYTPGTKINLEPLYYEQPESLYLEGSSLGTNKIGLNWVIEGDADYTQIYKYNPETKTYQYYTYTYNFSGITLSKNLIAGQTYWYKVRHVLKTPDGVKHYSELSNRVGVTPRPNAPTGLKAVKYKSKTAKLSWNKVTGADGYIVYKYDINTEKLSYIKSTKNLSTTTSYKNIAGKKYYYTIKAYKVVNGKKVFSTSSYIKSVIV